MTEQTPSDERPEAVQPPSPTAPTPPYPSLPYPPYPPLLEPSGSAPGTARPPTPRAWLAGGLAALLLVAGGSGFAIGQISADDGHPPISAEWQRPAPPNAPHPPFDDDRPAPPGAPDDD